MTQAERREYLICALLAEESRYAGIEVPRDEGEQRRLLRGLLNVRMPRETGEEFIRVQDEYLKKEIEEKGVTDYRDIPILKDGLRLWRGDITTLRCGAIVNAANSRLLGCFCPNHLCIDNAIHTFAGVQLRAACARLMAEQGHEEETGRAKLTPAFNLPSRYVLHTVGPIVGDRLTQRDRELLASCYRSCLELGEEAGVGSIAFCCISTGEFHFPNGEAARIAVETVQSYRAETGSKIEVIFNVFKELDERIYRELLGTAGKT